MMKIASGVSSYEDFSFRGARRQTFKTMKSLLKILIPTKFHGGLARYYFMVRELVRLWQAALCVSWQWQFKSGGRPHRLPATLIVSLTSYPPRFGTLSLTLRSLLRQTVKADRTILWIADADIPVLPKAVTDLRAAGLEIRATDDIRSYKKIIPALNAFPDAFICTADDDVYYWPTWLEQLVDDTSMTERIVTCHRAHKITVDRQGRFRPYKQWLLDVHDRDKSQLLFPTGAGGVLYPPGILRHTADDRETAFTLCPVGDDIWLYWICRRNGATYKTVGHWRDLVLWRGTQNQCLWLGNFNLGGNDTQIRKMAERYGYPAG